MAFCYVLSAGLLFFVFWKQSSASFGLLNHYLLVSSIRGGRRVFREKKEMPSRPDGTEWHSIMLCYLLHAHICIHFAQTENNPKRRRTSRPPIRIPSLLETFIFGLESAKKGTGTCTQLLNRNQQERTCSLALPCLALLPATVYIPNPTLA